METCDLPRPWSQIVHQRSGRRLIAQVSVVAVHGRIHSRCGGHIQQQKSQRTQHRAPCRGKAQAKHQIQSADDQAAVINKENKEIYMRKNSPAGPA